MMGQQTSDQSQLFYLFNLEGRIPAGHLLRRINPTVACASFDHLVGAQYECGRDLQSNRLRGLEIDDQLEFRRLIIGDLPWLLTLEDQVDILGDVTVHRRNVNRVGHEPPGFDWLSVGVDCRQTVLLGQLGDEPTVRGVLCLIAHNKPLRALLHHGSEYAAVLCFNERAVERRRDKSNPSSLSSLPHCRSFGRFSYPSRNQKPYPGYV